MMMILNFVAKGSAFLGSAYAAKCLGPEKLGISAWVISISQLIVVLAGGGLDNVAVRRIAAQPGCTRSITKKIIQFRAAVLAVLLPAGLWLGHIYMPAVPALVWCAAAALPLATCFALTFMFQGMERLPFQGTITVFTSVLATIAYFSFGPGVPVGADLVVLAVSGLIGAGLSFGGGHFMAVKEYATKPAPSLVSLLRESRPFWGLAFLIYCYYSLQSPLVGHIAGQRELGVYRSALLLSAGLDLFYYSINSLLLSRLIVWLQQGPEHLQRRQRELLVGFLLLGGAITLGLILLAPIIYQRCMGPEFLGAVLPFQILVVGRMVMFVGQIYAHSLIALHRDWEFFVATAAGAMFSVITNLLVIPRHGIVGAALVNSLTELLIHGLCFFFCWRRMKVATGTMLLETTR